MPTNHKVTRNTIFQLACITHVCICHSTRSRATRSINQSISRTTTTFPHNLLRGTAPSDIVRRAQPSNTFLPPQGSSTSTQQCMVQRLPFSSYKSGRHTAFGHSPKPISKQKHVLLAPDLMNNFKSHVNMRTTQHINVLGLWRLPDWGFQPLGPRAPPHTPAALQLVPRPAALPARATGTCSRAQSRSGRH